MKNGLFTLLSVLLILGCEDGKDKIEKHSIEYIIKNKGIIDTQDFNAISCDYIITTPQNESYSANFTITADTWGEWSLGEYEFETGDVVIFQMNVSYKSLEGVILLDGEKWKSDNVSSSDGWGTIQGVIP